METTAVKPRVTAKDFFLWLGAMAFLYASTIAFIALWFNYINAWFPNPLEYGDIYSSGMRFAIAALIVAFPVYVLLMRILHQDLRRSPEKKDLWVRKWLIFLTLFVAGITIAIDLVWLINTYLQGELTMRFSLKAAVILAVIGAGFWYYAYELRGVWEQKARASILIAGIVALVIAGSVIGSFFIIGSPETQRMVRLDNQRLSDLQNIQWQVINYWQTKQTLPESLEQLKDPLSGYVLPVDPESGEAYGYNVTKAPYSFEICALFATDSAEIPNQNMGYPYPTSVVKGGDDTWEHGVGQTCFERTIDPDRYPPVTQGAPVSGRD